MLYRFKAENKGTEKTIMAEEQIDIEQLLRDGYTIQIKPQGYSMYPMFVPDRDEAVIAPADGNKLRRGQVVLYRRKNRLLVLHRLWKVRPEGLYMVGDNQTEVEGPLHREQVLGILEAFVRKGRRISVRHPIYRFCSGLWLWMRPMRHRIAVIIHFLKKMIRK